MMFLGKSWKIEIQIISWHTSGRRLLCFYYSVTIHQLLRMKCVTVIESTIFIMSLDLDAVVEHVLLKSTLCDLLRTWHQNCWMNQYSRVELSRILKIKIILITLIDINLKILEVDLIINIYRGRGKYSWFHSLG